MNTKHYISFLLSLFLSIGTLAAQTNNRLYIPELTALPGSTLSIPVYVENTTEIVAVQFTLQVPEGSALTTTSAALTNRSADHTVTLRKTAPQEYLCVIFSSSNSPLKGRTGKIMTVEMPVPVNYVEGSVHQFALKDVVLSLSDGTNVLSSAEAGSLTIIKRPDLYVKNVQTDKTEYAPGETLSVGWQVQNIGGIETGDGWSEQISLVQTDGTNILLGTTYYDEILSASGSVSRQVSLNLPQLLGIDGQVRVQVQAIPRPNTGENEGARGNNISSTATDVNIKKLLTLTLPTGSIAETNTQPIRCTLARSGNRSQEQTFTLTATADSRLTVPQQVVIPAGQSSVYFYIQIADNTVLDDNEQITVTASGNGYDAVSGQFSIEDNEFPDLTITASKSQITEGETFQLTITTDRAPAVDMEVTLTSENNKRFSFPSKVTIPAGGTSVTFDVTAVDDELPSLELSNAFTASVPKYNGAEAIVVLEDNDLPVLELSLSPTTLSESAGPVAMIAVLRRTTNTDKDITVKLSDNSSGHDINYGQFSSITMAKNVEEVTFSLGVNDNLIVDGDRDVTITAAVYIQSCSCSAANSEGIGVVSQTVHIVDNDGPSLTLTSSRSMLLEGAEEATLLTVSRNTSVTEPLAVSITSNYDEGLEFNHNIVIPAGSRLTTIPVKVLANMIENDNITVTFTASATGHSDGICWAMVSDQTLPDAVVNTMELLSVDGENLGDDGVLVNTKLKAFFTVKNIGIVDLPAGTIVTLYQNSQRVTTMTTHEPLAPGESTMFSYILTVPNQIGTFTAHAKVNEDQTMRELIYANNTSPTASLQIHPSFTATVNVDKNVLQYGDSLTIIGHISPIGGTTWQAEGATMVDLYFLSDGQHHVQRVLADATGNFVFRWGPSRYQMGHFGIGACYPGEGIRTEMVGVDIYGMRRVSNHAISFNTILDQPYTGSIAITNPGRLPLTGVTISETNNPDEASITFNAPTSIAGGETINIGYTLTGHKIGGDNEWQTLCFTITTAEGPKLDYTLYYYTRNPEAQLSCSIKQINTTVTKGYARDYSFKVANIGMGNTGAVTLALPQWMQSVTPLQMPSMAKGDTTQVVIRMTPTEDMQLNVPVTGQLAINCENGNGLVIPFMIEPVSERTGNLMVDVCDEYTYYTDEAPHVCGASVTILHPTTGSVIAKDTTGVDGCFNVTLPEGYYTLLVTHPKHNSYRNYILLDPGKTTYKVVNLTYDAVQVSWDVVETTIEDVYDIITTVKYESQVPVPIVTVNMPQNIETHMLDEGESLIFYAIVTNKGLIAAEDVELSMPKGYTELSFERLDYEEPFRLAPQQSAIIPIKVTRLPYSSHQDSRRRVHKPLRHDDCYAQFPWSYYYVCGTDRKYHKYWNGIRLAECEGKEIPLKPQDEVCTDEGGWGGGYGTGGVGRPNYPGPLFGTTVTNQTRVSSGEPYECNPCAGLGLWHALKLVPLIGPILDGAETIKDIYNCGYALTFDEGVHDKLANCKWTAGAVRRFDRFIDTGKAIYDDLGIAIDGAINVVELTKNGQFFTEDCLDAWKDVFSGMYNAGEDFASFSSQAMSYANDLQSMSDQVTDGISYLQNEEKAWEEGNGKVFWATEDQRYNNKLDHEQEDKARREAKAQQLVETTKKQVKTSISTRENYDNLLKESFGLMMKGDLSREGFRKLGQDGVRVLSDVSYHVHKEFDTFRNNQKRMFPHNVDDYLETGEWDPFGNMSHASGEDNPLLKLDYLDNTEKLVEKADEVVDMLYYEFGGCDYEGTESDSEDIEPGGGKSWAKRRMRGTPQKAESNRAISYSDKTIPKEYLEFLEKAKAAVNIVRENEKMELEFFGDPEWMKLSYFQTAPVAWAIEQVEKGGAAAIDNPNISIYCPDGVSLEMMQKLLRRWYNTFYVSKNPSSSILFESDGSIQQINLQHLEEFRQNIKNEIISILCGGETSIEEAVAKPFREAVEKLNNRSSSVCASITLQFNQTMTMTRQAFRGILKVHNGNTEGAMENIKLQLEVRNTSDGSLATSREMYMGAETLAGFEGSLNLTEGWTLAPNGDGTATILFIPSKYAAPTEPVDYTFGGRLVYLDPYTGLEVTRELSPVTLTVKPSPELDLTYFMQRDIYGDDPLTEDVVEPMVPAEFALLINNIGNGDATNVRMVTNQPEIIENEKGLAINFEILSAQLNGGDKTMALGGSVATDFGTIPAHSQTYAQWWLQSSLLGHFTDYDVKATHVTSYGNPDLSLLNDVTIHELIRSIKVGDGGITGFVTNDLPDAEDLPDMVYFTDGTTDDVVIATNAVWQKQSSTEYLLTITPSRVGWNYGHVNDPTFGYSKLTGIRRQSDGKEINLRNFWQTDRTLLDGKDWLYEYRLHFIDDFASGGAQTYVLTFDPVPDKVLEVTAIGTVPAEGEIAEEPIEKLTVDFNKEIDATTFTGDDITFSVQGVKKNANQIVISTEDNKTFTLDMTAMNDTLPNGYYTMTVQTTDITDAEGFKGKTGKQVGWIMYRGGLVQLLTSVYPETSGRIQREGTGNAKALRAPAVGNQEATAEYGSTVTLRATPAEGYDFVNWTLNGEVVGTSPELNAQALSDMNIVANFTKKSYLVEVEAENGTIEGVGKGYYQYGEELTFTALPDADYIFTGWTVNGKDAGFDMTLTLTLDKALDIKANFARDIYHQQLTLQRGWNWVSSYISEAWPIDDMSNHSNRIVGQFDELINDPQFGLVGGLEQLTAGVAYKVEASDRFTTNFRGHLLPSSTNLKKGWNWIPYPWTEAIAVGTAITNAEDGDYLVSQHGFTEYADGYWEGTLNKLTPGEGYLYKSISNKQLCYDFTNVQYESHAKMFSAPAVTNEEVDVHRYPNTMNITARLYKDDEELTGSHYLVYAMANNELRGISEYIGNNYYITVYGYEPVDITFICESTETGSSYVANETLQFRDDVIGSRKSPFAITFGNTTGIELWNSDKNPMTVYTLKGILVGRNMTLKMLQKLPKGVYIINGQKCFVK